MLKVTTERGDITEFDGDAIVVNLFQGTKQPDGATGAVDAALGGAISQVIRSKDFEGKRGQKVLLYAGEALPAPRVVVVGLGKADEIDADAVRRATGVAVKALKGANVERAATIVHGAGAGGLDTAHAARSIAEAALSAAYTFKREGTANEEDESVELRELVVLERDGRKVSAVERGVGEGVRVGEAQSFTRDLSSVSGDEAAPAAIARRIEAMAEMAGLTCRVLGPSEIRSERMGGVLGVSKGSSREPRFVILEHAPSGARRKVCIVGKGVTFDTGGISMKRPRGMDKMRYDKSGAAATAGVLRAVAELDLPVHVIGLMPFVENMPSGRAIKPGDVLTMRSGHTVDVLNTDAEGRLILADALDYAKELEPDYTVDMATLTGAVSVALGTQAAGIMGNDQGLIDQLLDAGEVSRERIWQLPFYDEYKEQLKGVIGDIKNVGGRNAGTVTAGKFLEHFAPEEGWAHLDIASTAWNDSKPLLNGDYTPKGSTGAGVRLLVTWLETL